MNNNTEEYFRKSEGAGIDNDNFTNPGSGEGFDSGRDFPSQPVTESSPSRDRNTYEPPENNDDEPDFPTPEIRDIQAELDASRPIEDDRFETARQFREFQASILDENSLIFDSEYYLKQNPDVAAARVDAGSHFTFYGILENREYRYVLLWDLSAVENADYIEADLILGIQSNLIGEKQDFGSSTVAESEFDRDYYLA